jgi:hypothetical protein
MFGITHTVNEYLMIISNIINPGNTFKSTFGYFCILLHILYHDSTI